MEPVTRRSRPALLGASLLLLALAAACGGGALPASAPVPPEQPEAAAGERGDSDALAITAAQERLIVRNAVLTITAADARAAAREVQALASEMGGFLVSSEVGQQFYTGAKLWRATVVVRVPVERLDEALERIRSSALTVEQENITGQDVTDQYTDLQSRLRNQQASEEQLLTIMAGATETEDVLAVQQQLTSVREQIEVLQGQINYLEQSAALSEVRVEIEPNAADRPLEIPGWNPSGVVRDAFEAMIAGLQTIATGVIWFVVYVVPVCILPAAILGGPLVWWYLRRRKRQPGQRPESQPQSGPGTDSGAARPG